MEIQKIDAIVIGAGQAGGPLAGALGKAGWQVALVEREHVGGTCINEGCTPTKTMIASARVAYLTRRAADYGVNTGSVSIDLEKVRQRKRAIVESFRKGSERSLGQIANVRQINGEGHFVGSKQVQVNQVQLEAEHIFINVGTRPFIPAIPGLSKTPFLTSTSVMELDHVPERLLILGAGYVGLEFAQMFQRFGSKVVMVARGHRLLPLEDQDVSDAMADILHQDGVEVLFEHNAQDVRYENGEFVLNLKNPGGLRELRGDQLLVAAGRTSNSDSLDLQATGVETDERGFIKVNEQLQTNVDGIYALGDVTGGPAFTHVSYDDYRIVRDNLLSNAGKTTQGRIVPHTVFTDPQLGRVGLSETEARQGGYEIKVAKIPMSRVSRAIETDETRGFMKAVVEVKTGKILGAAVLGLEGGEVMSIFQMAMMGQLPYTALRDAVFAHPTLSESINNLFMALG